MLEAAITITSHIGYVGAGTVEFIMDSKGEFYFLEMNTRLQVEHPVTEMITGLDLVRLQLEVAQGRKLPVTQKDVSKTATPSKCGSMPKTRSANSCPRRERSPAFTPHLPHVRCENGYASGNVVSASYDPMIAKLAAWGATRDEAIARLLNALAQTQISGVVNNRAFLMRVLDHPAFRAGKTSTDFIPKHKSALMTPRLQRRGIGQLCRRLASLQRNRCCGVLPKASEHSAWNNPRLAGMR